MPTVNIHWSEAAPANSDNVGLGAQEIRSLKTDLRNGLAAEHLWSSTGGAAGAHLLGSARPYVGPTSEVSSDGTAGRLMFNSTTSDFFYLSDTTAERIGGRGTPVAYDTGANSANASMPANHRTEIFYGEVTTAGGSAIFPITFPGSGYSGIPNIQLTCAETAAFGSGNYLVATAHDCTATGFTVRSSVASTGAAFTTRVNWMSMGTVVVGRAIP